MIDLSTIVGIGGFALGVAVAGAGSWAYDGLWDDPAVVRETRASCAAEASQAAMEATIAQWQRSQAKIDELNRQFDEISQERARAQSQANRGLNEKIAAFEAAGLSQCSVTVDNLDFLRPG